MRMRPIAPMGALAALLALACANDGSNESHNAPYFNTGAAATIIDPGQRGPGVPAYPLGYPGAPAAGQPGVAPNAGAAAVPGRAAAPPAYAGVPYGGSNMTMLGGATTIDTRQKTVDHISPMKRNPLLWPVYAIAWPFYKIGRAVSGGNTSQHRSGAMSSTQQSGPGTPTAAAAPPVDPQLAYEQAQIQAMKQQLAQRQAATPGTSPAAAPVRTASAAPSIAEELAALRAGTPRSEDLARSAPGPEWNAGPTAPSTPSGVAQPALPEPAMRVEDRDGDGRPDHWIYGRNGQRTREVFDDNGDGKADRTLFYDPATDRLQRSEEDTNGDGVVDSWALYENGVLTRRRADANGDGVVDTWTFYKGEQITRQESDTDGDGFRDRVEYYEGGKLARRTEDLDADGRPDRTTLFDTASGQPTEQDEDRNGDGQVDVRSFYTEGRLVRRELLNGDAATP